MSAPRTLDPPWPSTFAYSGGMINEIWFDRTSSVTLLLAVEPAEFETDRKYVPESAGCAFGRTSTSWVASGIAPPLKNH